MSITWNGGLAPGTCPRSAMMPRRKLTPIRQRRHLSPPNHRSVHTNQKDFSLLHHLRFLNSSNVLVKPKATETDWQNFSLLKQIFRKLAGIWCCLYVSKHFSFLLGNVNGFPIFCPADTGESFWLPCVISFCSLGLCCSLRLHNFPRETVPPIEIFKSPLVWLLANRTQKIFNTHKTAIKPTSLASLIRCSGFFSSLNTKHNDFLAVCGWQLLHPRPLPEKRGGGWPVGRG